MMKFDDLRKIDTYDRVILAREIRGLMESGELFHTWMNRPFYCPICLKDVNEHLYKIPCYRMGEWDRYNLHVSATPPFFGKGN